MAGAAALALILAGCALPRAAGQARLSGGAEVAKADLGYAPAALDRAVEALRAPAAGASPPAPSTGGLFGPSGSQPRLQTELDYRAITGQDDALTLILIQPYTQGWSARVALRAGQGRVDHVIPAGQLRIPLGSTAVTIGDPTTLHARTRFAEGEIMMLRRVALPALGKVELGAGAGLRATHSRLQVSSPLVVLDSTHRQGQTYAALQARYSPPRLPADFFVEGRAYGRRAAGVRAGLTLVWP